MFPSEQQAADADAEISELVMRIRFHPLRSTVSLYF